MRAHVVLPDDLVEEVDRLVGKRKRSAFITETLRERLRSDQLLRTLREVAGSVKAADHPEWTTSRKVAAWVRKQRRQSSQRIGPPYG